ncbi:hypothetical protein [Fodinicurvata halophila]|uniref:hypothetical protein n=1 Tax=Fodinicurvata halophila TaxID=1419723 RepID=UPI003625C307
MVAIREHIENVVVNYKIPTNLEQRFEWISSGDVHVKQELLNHLRQMEKSLVEEGAREQLPVMLDHLQSDEGHHTHRMAQVLKVGNHELEVLMDKMASGVHLEEGGRLEEPRQSHRPVTSSGAGHGWIWWLVIGAVILFFLMR